jgi:hypothetical protein
MLTIAFHDNCLGERGTTTALFDYALYNETVLKNKSIILFNASNSNDKNVVEKFTRVFKDRVYGYYFWQLVDDILQKENCDILYLMKYGNDDGKLSKVCKNVVHCVFESNQPHGDVYASLSSSVLGIRREIVPYMVNLPTHDLNMRQELNIPEDAIVLGRYGGYEQFDIPFVHEAIRKVVKNNKKIYFLFANTRPFTESLNIIYLDKIYNLDHKVKFINTCDAMIWAREDGETFGLSIGEFCIKGKAIIAKKCGYLEHYNIMGDTAIWYENESDLVCLLEGLTKDFLKSKRSHAYDKYSPENVMQIFKKVFIDQ